MLTDKLFIHRQDAKRRQPVFKFTQWPKICIFAPQGRLVAPIHVKFGVAEGTVGPLKPAKFQANRCPGWEHGHKMAKCFNF